MLAAFEIQYIRGRMKSGRVLYSIKIQDTTMKTVIAGSAQ
jgi:hypothetical protein